MREILIERPISKNPAFVKNVQQADSRYTEFQKRGAKGAVLHSIGTPQPSAKVIADYFDSPNVEASVHAVLQADGVCYQLAPWNYRLWHVGGRANNTHLGVEMTEPDCIAYDAKNGYKLTILDRERALAHVKATYQAAVELFAALCKEFGWNPLEDGVILSHAECYKRGIGSNHGDPEHLWDALNTGYSMDTFRAAVKQKMEEEEEMRYQTIDDVPAWAKKETQELIDLGALRGNENGIDVTEDMLRTMIINLRATKALMKN